MKKSLHKKIAKSKFLIQAVRIHLSIITVIMISVLLMYWLVRNSYVDRIIDDTYLDFESKITKMDSVLKNVMHSTERTINSNVFEELVTLKNNYTYANFLMKKISKDIAYDELSLPVDNETLLYFAEYNKLVYREGSFDASDFSDYLKNYGNDNSEQWEEKYLNRNFYHTVLHSVDVNYNEVNKRRIMYIHTYPNGVSIPKCTIVKFISEESINEILSPSEGIDKYTIRIIDKENEILNFGSEIKNEKYQKGIHKEKIDGKNYIVFCSESKVNKWKYAEIIPIREILKYLWLSDVEAGLLLIFCVFSISVLFFAFVNKNASFLKRLITKLGGVKEEYSDEIEIIGSAIDTIMINNSFLERNLEKSKSYLKMSFLFQLINGNFKSMDSIEWYIQNYELDIDIDSKYIVASFLIDRSKFVSQTNYISNYDLAERIEKSAHNFPFEYNVLEYAEEFIVVIKINNTNENEISKFVDDVCKNDDSIHAYVGLAYDGIMGVYYSYNDICNAKNNYSKLYDKKIVFMTEEKPATTSYYYSIKVEEMMINMVTVGNADEIVRLVDRLYTDKFKLNPVNSMDFKIFRNQIFSTLTRIYNECFDSNEQQMKNFLDLNCDMMNIENVEEFFCKLKELMSTLCEFSCNIEQRKKKKLEQSLIEYLENNYQNINLSLSMIASEFNYSEAYFSRIFKKTFGVTYGAYLENLRIEKSLELLEDTRLMINDVSASVGYANVQAFRKAFKRCKGVLPSEYKNK